MSAEGRPLPSRRPPPVLWDCTADTTGLALQDVPPLVEVKALIDEPLVENGTMTVPFGCTRGWPPSPMALLAVGAAADQVAPPSVDVDISTRFPAEVRSTST